MKRTIIGLCLVVVFTATGLAQDQKAADTAAASEKKVPVPAAATLTAEVQVCTSITDRMPTGTASSFAADVGTLYCWSKITGAKGETAVKHVWSHEGKEMLSVDLSVKSISWRTFSQKSILPSWTGNWEVKVVDAGGATLASAAFTVGQTSR
ncbi:MAG: DUF2914 domain-containing protein [candidate division Zixibacteria bacterium]|nr:DUF2914 domain-containing protein [candidate division Zixibacteria bacterium]